MQDVMVRSLREECLHLERLFRSQGAARFPEQLAECRSLVEKLYGAGVMEETLPMLQCYLSS